MKFIAGSLEGVWCDNPDCPYFDGRSGIPKRTPVVPGKGPNEHFCSEDCKKQAPEARRIWTQRPMGLA